MKTNSEFAKTVFGPKLEWAKDIGHDQVAHTVRRMTEDFHQNAFMVVADMSLDDIITRHAQCITDGIVDQHMLPAPSMSAIRVAGHNALSLRTEGSENLLFVWKERQIAGLEEPTLEFYALSWFEHAPETLVEEFAVAVETGQSFEAADPLIRRLVQYSGLAKEGKNRLHDRLPMNLEDILQLFEKEGVEKTALVAGIGHLTRNTMMDLEYHALECSIGWNISLASIQSIHDHFQQAPKYLGDKGKEQLAGLRAGRLDELCASCSVLSLEYSLDRFQGHVTELVSAGQQLGLSNEFLLTHRDSDVWLYSDRIGAIDLYVNEDIDLDEGCAFAIVVSHVDGGASAVNVYLVRRWDIGFEDRFRCAPTDPMSGAQAQGYLDYMARHPDWIGEYALVDSLREGVLPLVGRAYSYDIQTQACDIGPLAETTRFLAYLPSMIKRDHKILVDAAAGVFPEWGSNFRAHSRDSASHDVETVEISDFLQRKAGPSI